MAQRDPSDQKSSKAPTHSAQDVRGAEIILRTRTRKYIFFGGMIALVVLVFVLGLLRLAGG